MTVLAWRPSRPVGLTRLLCEKRIAEVCADHADGCAEARKPYSDLDYRRWKNLADEHREQARLIQFRIDYGDTAREPHRLDTHCRNGHEYTPDSIWARPDGTRGCKVCRRAREAREYREGKR